MVWVKQRISRTISGRKARMTTAIAKPLSAVIIIIAFIVLFFSRNDVAVAISAFMFLVGAIMLLTTAVIDMVEG